MKKIIVFLTVMAMVFGIGGIVQAYPTYYTFTGTVSKINDNAGIAKEANLLPGHSVTYTWLVDVAADGSYTKNDGTEYTFTDTSYVDFFYTDFISGSLIDEKDGGHYNKPDHIAEYNAGGRRRRRCRSRRRYARRRAARTLHRWARAE